MLQEGLFVDFQALPFTTLADHFSDHHFLYHVFLLPFVFYFQPLIGIKFAHVALCSLLTILIYRLARGYFRYSGLIAVVLLLSNGPFLLRMTLPKAVPVAAICLLLGVKFAFSKRVLLLFLISFLFALSYGGYLVLPFVLLLFAFEAILHWNFKSRRQIGGSWGTSDTYVKELIASLVGSGFGTVLHPYFPNNLSFLVEQLGRIALLEESPGGKVGREWIGVSLSTIYSNQCAAASCPHSTLGGAVLSLSRVEERWCEGTAF